MEGVDSLATLPTRSRTKSVPASVSDVFQNLKTRNPSDGGDNVRKSSHWAIEAIIFMLHESSVPGPAVMVSGRKELGQGSQFIVYEQEMYDVDRDRAVAVKQPKFNFDLKENDRFDLGGSQTRRHLEHIMLEIKALTMPSLRHPNIVRLLAFSFDTLHPHSPLTLITELASSDLSKLLATSGFNIPWSQRWGICSQIAAGLDAIHEASIVHGDLKPQNILIFKHGQGGNQFLAKLADFGLSIGDLKKEHHGKERLGGTLGWQAPEVERAEHLDAEGLRQADSYSFGLLVWSTLSGRGSSPSKLNQHARDAVLKAEAQKAMAEGSLQNQQLSLPPLHGISLLLQVTPEERPPKFFVLFEHDSSKGRSSSKDHATEEIDNQGIPSRVWPWEPVLFSNYFLGEIQSKFLENHESIAPGLLFSVFLCLTRSDHQAVLHSRLGPTRQAFSPLAVLNAAAKRGFVPARACLARVYEYYAPETFPNMEQRVVDSLQAGIMTGSIVSRQWLERLDPSKMKTTARRFRDRGGHCQLFWYNNPSNPILHCLVVGGTFEEVKQYLDLHPALDIDERASFGTTPLFLACARGLFDIACVLLDRGADVSVRCTQFQVTCLHWLFAFEPEFQPHVLQRLIRAGAVIDARALHPTPFNHYPFILPAGTPLHWAVVLDAHAAMKTLVSHGADPFIRDKSDPYRYEREVMMLDRIDGITDECFSFPDADREPMGLSPLDYAAMDHNPFVFETLVDLGKRVSVLDVDEEGFNLFHRLSANPIRRTRAGIRFSSSPFQGNENRRAAKLRRTIAAIKAFGGDYGLDQFTTPCMDRSYTRSRIALHHYTPLMMAALGFNADIVKVLIEMGSGVDLKNNEGRTALQCLSEANTVAVQNVRMLVAAGADITHRDKRGETALCIAAGGLSHLDLMELLLSSGGGITDSGARPEWDSSNNSNNSNNRNVFGVMARAMSRFSHFDSCDNLDIRVMDDERRRMDEQFTTLLENFVYQHEDTTKRAKVLEKPSYNGETLLYCLSRSMLVRSSQSLINYGVNVNAISTGSTLIPGEGTQGRQNQVKIEWQRTALDIAILKKDCEIERIRHTNRTKGGCRYLPAAIDTLTKGFDEVIKVLKEAGGVQVSSEQVSGMLSHYSLGFGNII